MLVERFREPPGVFPQLHGLDRLRTKKTRLLEHCMDLAALTDRLLRLLGLFLEHARRGTLKAQANRTPGVDARFDGERQRLHKTGLVEGQ